MLFVSQNDVALTINDIIILHSQLHHIVALTIASSSCLNNDIISCLNNDTIKLP